MVSTYSKMSLVKINASISILMKKLSILLFSLFFLSSPSVFADDISDFSIEGISIGDSLLDYMIEDEILEQIERTKDYFLHLKEPNKYAFIKLTRDFPTYDSVDFLIKNNAVNQYVGNKNEKYTILYVAGYIKYIEDFDSCIQKRDEVVKVLSRMFPDIQKIENVYKSIQDPSGNSIRDDIQYNFDSGAEVEAECSDFEETYRVKNNMGEGLLVSITHEETKRWFSDHK